MELCMKDFSKFVSCCLYSQSKEEFESLFSFYQLKQEQVSKLFHLLVYMFIKEDELTAFKLSRLKKLYNLGLDEKLVLKLLEKNFISTLVSCYDENIKSVLEKYDKKNFLATEKILFMLCFF